MKPLITEESEKVTEKTLTREVEKIGGQSYKWASANRSGVPDRICFFPGGLIKFVEVKSEGVKPTDLQLEIHRRLRALGHKVTVVDTREKVKTFIDKVKEELCSLQKS